MERGPLLSQRCSLFFAAVTARETSKVVCGTVQPAMEAPLPGPDNLREDVDLELALKLHRELNAPQRRPRHFVDPQATQALRRLADERLHPDRDRSSSASSSSSEDEADAIPAKGAHAKIKPGVPSPEGAPPPSLLTCRLRWRLCRCLCLLCFITSSALSLQAALPARRIGAPSTSWARAAWAGIPPGSRPRPSGRSRHTKWPQPRLCAKHAKQAAPASRSPPLSSAS